VGAEIAKWIGVPSLDDRQCFRRKRGHATTSSACDSTRKVPANGTRNQSGR
jgi:hypothetical protein